VADHWYTGNANTDADANRGWLLGHFIQPDDDIRATEAVEVKWGIHPAGQERPDGWTVGETRSTVIILVSGRFRVDLAGGGGSVLADQGDYLVWGPGTDHIWRAEEDSVVVTVRWPSRPI
jgi:mannose-6-phosphate isomerase-like protein (cupin superfamily)